MTDRDAQTDATRRARALARGIAVPSAIADANHHELTSDDLNELQLLKTHPNRDQNGNNDFTSGLLAFEPTGHPIIQTSALPPVPTSYVEPHTTIIAAPQEPPVHPPIPVSATGAFSTPSLRQYPGTQRLTALDAAQITQESGWDPNSVSSKGCVGLMQIQPQTGIEWGNSLGIKAPDGSPLNADNIQETLKNPANNVRIGHAYQQWLLHGPAHGNVAVAAAAYNAGTGRVFGYTDKKTGRHVPGWVDTNGDPSTGAISDADWIAKIPFDETKKYATNVIAMAERNERAALEQEARHPHHTPTVKDNPKKHRAIHTPS